jgi:hypothetical protein
MAYAIAKKALGICDRCGFTYKLQDLQYEIEDQTRNGLKVCNSCLDPDHPQLQVGKLNTADPQALYEPRTDSGEESSTVYFGFKPVNSTGMVMRGGVGKVTISIG